MVRNLTSSVVLKPSYGLIAMHLKPLKNQIIIRRTPTTMITFFRNNHIATPSSLPSASFYQSGRSKQRQSIPALVNILPCQKTLAHHCVWSKRYTSCAVQLISSVSPALCCPPLSIPPTTVRIFPRRRALYFQRLKSSEGMETPVARTGPQLALMESQNIIQDAQVGGGPESAPPAQVLSSCAPVPPLTPEATIPRVEAETPTPTTSIATVDEKLLQGTVRPEESQEAVKAEAGDVSAPTERSTNQPSEIGPEDSEAASLALARQLLEEEAMASYATAVDMLRAGGGDGVSSGEGSLAAIEGVSLEDMSAMRALMEEDEMASSDTLDYDDMLELGSAIGDVRQERWRLRCHEVINQLPLLKYVAGGLAREDSKCLVCQCDFEEGEELRKLPCNHTFHAECVDSWLEQSEECPTCRRSVSQG